MVYNIGWVRLGYVPVTSCGEFRRAQGRQLLANSSTWVMALPDVSWHRQETISSSLSPLAQRLAMETTEAQAAGTEAADVMVARLVVMKPTVVGGCVVAVVDGAAPHEYSAQKV